MNDSIDIVENVVDISSYVEIIYMYRCRTCGVTDSSMRAIGIHILTDHVKRTPPELISTDDVGTDEGPSTVLSTSDVCSEAENGVCEEFVGSSQVERKSRLTGQCTKSAMPDTKQCTNKVNDRSENDTRRQIDKKSAEKSEIANLVLQRSTQTTPVQSLQINFELQSPGLITSRSENTNTMPGIVKRPRSQPVGKSSKSCKNTNYIGDCMNAKKVPVDHSPKNSEIIIQKFVCSLEYCSARFSTTENLEYHQKCHNALTNTPSSGSSLLERMSRCPECLELSPTWNTLQLHLWAQHDIDVELLSCSECAFRTDTVQKLRAHQSTHCTDKPHCCRVCGLGFECNVERLTHANEHKRYVGDGGKEVKVRGSILCDTCGAQYANQHILKNHIEDVHNKRKPFTCSICGHPSSRKHMWLAHLRTHTGEKPYRCDMCNYSASDHNSLRRHKMRHTGKTSYKCVRCDYACIQSIQLKTHLKRKHPGMNDGYTCVECRYSTVSRRNWLAHQRKCARNSNTHTLIESTATSAKV